MLWFICQLNRCATFGIITGITVSFGREPGYFTPAAGTSKVVQNCLNCRALTCPPIRPCKLGDKCYEPKSNKRGISWCPIRKFNIETWSSWWMYLIACMMIGATKNYLISNRNNYRKYSLKTFILHWQLPTVKQNHASGKKEKRTTM